MDNPKIHLTFVITGLNMGGAEMMLYRLLQKINRDLFECRVISLTNEGVVGARIRALDIPVKNLGMSTNGFNPFLFLKLFYWLLSEKADLVQTWMYHADLLGGLAAWMAGIPVVWNIHNTTLHPEGNRRTGYVVKINAVLSRIVPKRIITCSQTARDLHMKLGYMPSKFEVIPNGFDVDLFHPDAQAVLWLRNELEIDRTELIVGNVARFDPQKDHQTLVAAAHILVSRFPAVKFVLCGDQITWKNDKLAAWITDAGLKSSFYLLGRRDDIARIMPGFDLLVVSSSAGEAFPIVLGEAMACGVPCVATDVGDSGFIMGDTGILVPSGDPTLLADGMTTLLFSPETDKQVRGLKARKRVVDHFNLPDIVSRYEATYLQILRR